MKFLFFGPEYFTTFGTCFERLAYSLTAQNMAFLVACRNPYLPPKVSALFNIVQDNTIQNYAKRFNDTIQQD